MNKPVVDKRALLHQVGGRLVRAIAAEQGPYSDALFDVVRERRRVWTLDDWTATLHEIDTSMLTVNQFLSAEAAR